MMSCLEGVVDRRKVNDLISRQDHGQEASSSKLPNARRLTGVEPGSLEWKREVITITLGAPFLQPLLPIMLLRVLETF